MTAYCPADTEILGGMLEQLSRILGDTEVKPRLRALEGCAADRLASEKHKPGRNPHRQRRQTVGQHRTVPGTTTDHVLPIRASNTRVNQAAGQAGPSVSSRTRADSLSQT